MEAKEKVLGSMVNIASTYLYVLVVSRLFEEALRGSGKELVGIYIG